MALDVFPLWSNFFSKWKMTSSPLYCSRSHSVSLHYVVQDIVTLVLLITSETVSRSPIVKFFTKLLLLLVSKLQIHRVGFIRLFKCTNKHLQLYNKTLKFAHNNHSFTMTVLSIKWPSYYPCFKVIAMPISGHWLRNSSVWCWIKCTNLRIKLRDHD